MNKIQFLNCINDESTILNVQKNDFQQFGNEIFKRKFYEVKLFNLIYYQSSIINKISNLMNIDV